MKAANATSFEQYKNMANAVSDSVKHVTFSAPAYIPALRSSEPLVGAYASIAEVNKLSAPIKGNGGVFVLQPYAKEKLNETFNKETEEANLANMHARMASQFISDLYLKANVKDQRIYSSKNRKPILKSPSGTSGRLFHCLYISFSTLSVVFVQLYSYLCIFERVLF